MRFATLSTHALVVAIASSLSACASLAPPPERPAYTGADTVDAVDAPQLVGRWSPTELNPLPDSEGNEMEGFLEISADGTAMSRFSPAAGSSAAALGDMVVETGGLWRVDGGEIVFDMQEYNVESDNPLVKMASGLTRSLIPKGESRANVYELGANHFVIVGEEGVAMRYDRL